MTDNRDKPAPNIAENFSKTTPPLDNQGSNQNPERDSFGRTQTGWIVVNGKNRPHP
jgi:hypothetical protein